MPNFLRLIRRTTAPLLLITALSGCAVFAAQPHYRGNAVSQNNLKQLVPHVATEADARALLGSPTLRETFNDHDWLYVSQITKRRIGRTQGVLHQHVVSLRFNDQGVLQSIQQYNRKASVKVAMASGATKAPGGSASFFQELVGGVGSYNPLGAGAGNSLGGGVNPGAGSGGGGGGGGLSGF